MVGKFCGLFGTEAVYFRFMLKDFQRQWYIVAYYLIL